MTFVLTEEDFEIVTPDLRRVVEPGEFDVMVGSASDQIHLQGRLILGGD